MTSRIMSMLAALGLPLSLQSLSTEEKVSLGLMVLGIATQLIALLYGFLNIWTCCCRSCIAYPLIIFAKLAFLLLLGGWLVYLIFMNNGDFTIPNQSTNYSDTAQPGYSLWLAIGADALMLVNSVIACFIVKVSKVPLM